MQDRYAGDIGDFVKLALLRQLSAGRRLGIAWYLYPNQNHNADGKHVSYLRNPARWRGLDPQLFDALEGVVENGRSVASLEASSALDAKFSSEALISAHLPAADRPNWRSGWFSRTLTDLSGTDFVFAGPDNGLVDDNPSRRRQKYFGKQMPLAEAVELARGRTAVIYHHNTRFKGGHSAEVEHWRSRLGDNTVAVRATAYNCRTFFIINPDDVTVDRARSFCRAWAQHNVHFLG